MNSLVGLRPTKGLSSIAGIVPLSVTQDVGGPLARSVGNLATMLDATIGEDPDDPATHLPPGQSRPKFMEALQITALKNAHIGTLEPLFGGAGDDPEVNRIVRASIEEFKKEGAVATSRSLVRTHGRFERIVGNQCGIQKGPFELPCHERESSVHSLEEIVHSGLIHAALATGDGSSTGLQRPRFP